MYPNYTCAETENQLTKPEGDGWKYWSDRVLLDDIGLEIERVAVWRRDADVYGEYNTSEEVATI